MIFDQKAQRSRIGVTELWRHAKLVPCFQQDLQLQILRDGLNSGMLAKETRKAMSHLYGVSHCIHQGNGWQKNTLCPVVWWLRPILL